jgi:hypothetical protein
MKTLEIYKTRKNEITYSNILSNIDIVKDINLTKKLMSLSYKELSGGIKTVWNYPNENPSNVVIAFENSEPIGVITNTNGNQNIFIKPEYRKLGIGSKLKDIMYNRKTSIEALP